MKKVITFMIYVILLVIGIAATIGLIITAIAKTNVIVMVLAVVALAGTCIAATKCNESMTKIMNEGD